MSILIEALCLVVPRHVLDVSFPGGTDTYLNECATDTAVRYAIADEHLTAVSAFDPAAIERITLRLAGHGIVGADGNDQAEEFVGVDMQLGPIIPCTWLEFERHRHGMTVAWFMGREPGRLVVPDAWTPEASWRLQRADIRDDGPDNVLPLSTIDGIDSVLDFRTGEVLMGPETRSSVEHIEPEAGSPAMGERTSWMDERLIAAQRVLNHLGVPYSTDRACKEIAVLFALDEHPYDMIFSYDESRRLRIAVRSGAAADTLRFETTVPFIDSRCGDDNRAAELQRRLGVELDGELYEIDYDQGTGTLSLVLTQCRGGEETWEQTVESGFVCASRIGTGAFHEIGVRRQRSSKARVSQRDDLPSFEELMGYPEPDDE